MPSGQLERSLKQLEDRADGVSERAYARRLTELSRQLDAARKQPSPGLALHRANARTGLFQLEALARVHAEVIDADAFGILRAMFKSLEDALGAVDFHDSVVRSLGENNGSDLRGYFLGRRAEACATLERMLTLDGWWSPRGAPGESMRLVLQSIDDARWPGPRKERQRIAGYYADAAMNLQGKLAAGRFDFEQLESGVHEVRRRLRWLSIVPASFDGLFMRPEDTPLDPALAAYCTPAVIASPFNRFPRRKDIPDPIVLEPSAFLAMSWLIAELGHQKDRAQLSEAIVAAALDLGEPAKTASARARKVVGDAPVTHAVIARDVGRTVQRFVRDKVLVKLARGAEGDG